MELYTVTIATGTSEYSGTNNYVFVTLVGDEGESERTLLDNPGLDFCRGAVSGAVMNFFLFVVFLICNVICMYCVIESLVNEYISCDGSIISF